ncbi:MAG: lysylphosphatidylglycerol synthase domain-containing protein [Desulfuromonadaceae bacterium]|nr:lysylphosphatidylglycerol synthase domain-containing protein [Desulfuromonadaceae bacterium]
MKKTLRISASVLIIILIGYFYFLELKKNWTVLHNHTFTVNIYFLTVSLSLLILSYLLDTYIWKACINRHLKEHELTFPESIAILNASGLFKYLPGRIWMYTAQLAWLKKYGISNSKIFHSDLICIIGSITVSLYLGLVYTSLYTDLINANLIIISSTVLLLLNVLYITCNSILLNKIITAVNKYFKQDIQLLTNSIPLLVYVQFIYACSWLLTGFSGYFLAKGVGLQIETRELFALIASMSLSWLVGYLAVFTPAGLGVREGFMLLMLNNVMNVQTALLFPILSRVMFLLAEALLGLMAFYIGIKLKVFSSGRSQQL